MFWLNKHLQRHADPWGAETDLQPVATKVAAATGAADGRMEIEAQAWISAVHWVFGHATLPLVLLGLGVLLLHLLCLIWCLSWHARRGCSPAHPGTPSPRAVNGCRWGGETLPRSGKRTVWVCADCGAIAYDTATRPPIFCQQRPPMSPPAPPPEAKPPAGLAKY